MSFKRTSFELDQRADGVWLSRLERLADGTLEPISEYDWHAFEWHDDRRFGEGKRVFWRGKRIVDPDDF